MQPTIAQVLTSGGTTNTVNPLVIAAGFAAFMVMAFSAVKSVEIFRRREIAPALLDEPPPLALSHDKEKIDKLSFLAAELKMEREKLIGQTAELQEKNHNLQVSIDNHRQNREALEKSNFALVKENERLKSEKEELVLKASKPLVKIKSIKKEVKRKPAKRVSAKKK